MTAKDQLRPARDRRGLIALSLYAILSIAFFARSVAHDFTGVHLGRGPDPSFLMWALVWWPYALAHHLNPFLCRIVWAPAGFNLVWSGSIPIAALIGAPLTRKFDPVATYNVLSIVAPAIAAWCAFLLCRDVVKRYWPSFAGGYIFGFSSYMLGQMVGGHLNLLFVFPAPLVVKLTLHRMDRRLRAWNFALLLAIVFAIQFLLSIELAATVLLFGGLTLIIGWILGTRDGRQRIAALRVPLVGAGALAACILSPYLYYLFLFEMPSGAINSPGAYSADLLNLLVPTPTIGLGVGLTCLAALSRHFPGNLGEAGAYLGIPLVAMIALYARAHWHEALARMLISVLVLISILALGPRLRIAGITAFGMPWKLFMHVPLLKSALPVRFMTYASLAAGLIAALWLADGSARLWLRVVLAAGAGLLSLPNPDSGFFCAPVNTPSLFTNGAYREYLNPAENVVVLPYGITGASMLWQAETGMYFAMAGGYTGITPREFARWPIVGAFLSRTSIPDAKTQLLAFMAAHNSSVVVVDDHERALWAKLLAGIDQSPVDRGGVSVYRARQKELTEYRDASASELEKRCDAQRMAAMLIGANRYLQQGHDPAQFAPMTLQRLGLLPPDWVTDPDVRTNNGLYLSALKNGAIAIGLVGTYEGLSPVIAKYRGNAAQVFFPYPKELNGIPAGDTFMRLLVIVFDRAGLANAAVQAADATAP